MLSSFPQEEHSLGDAALAASGLSYTVVLFAPISS
jgi:hypothetical protein